MLRSIIGWSLRSRFVVIAIAVGLMVLGISQLGGMSVDTLPEFSRPTVEVQTEALGLSAEEVEQLITVPLEQDLLNGVAFLDEIESVSLPGLSSVVMTFEPGTELLDARQVVQERLTQSHGLPQVADLPQMLQPLSSTSRVGIIQLSSDELTPIETSVLARWVIVPRLLGVEGVANVSIWGFRDRQLQVLVDPQQLAGADVTLNEIIRTTGNALEVSPLTYLEASQPGTGGWIDTVNQRLHVFHEQTINTPEELSQVPLEGLGGEAPQVGGERLTLGDVSQVVEGHQPLIGDAHCQGGPCTLLVVEKFPDANTPEVARGVDATLEAMRPGLGGMQIDTSIYRPAEYITSGFGNLATRLLIGGGLLLLVLGLIFMDWRKVVIAGVAVPLALVVAQLVLHARGATVNIMVAAGLAAGLVYIVDGAVNDTEGIARARLDHAPEGNGGPLRYAILAAAQKMRSAGLFAALIVFAALLPAFFTTGIAGAFLPPIVLSYLLAIGASFVVALTVTPALALLLYSRARRERGPSPIARALGSAYDRMSGAAVPSRSVAIVGLVALLGAGILALPFLATELDPDLRERDVVVHLRAEPGTSLERMDEVVASGVDEIGALDGVRKVAAHVGRAITASQVVDVNEGEIWIDLDPSGDYNATLDAVDGIVEGLPDVASELTTYSDQRIAAVIGGSDGSTEPGLIVRIYGESPDVLREKAEEVRTALSGIDGVSGAEIDVPEAKPTITVEVDLERAEAHGVKPGDVRRAAAVLLSGITVGNLFEEQKVFDVVVWGHPEIRQTADDVRELPIDTPSGDTVALGEVADVRIEDHQAVIRHHSVMSYLDVVPQVEGRSLVDVAAEAEQVIGEVGFPLEYHAEVLGGYAELALARTRTLLAAAAAVLAIFLLLQGAFASWRQATLAFVALLASLSGGLVATWIGGSTVTLGTIVGLAAVLGFAARATITTIRHYRYLELHEGVPFGPELAIRGARDRAVPTLASALAVAAVMAPFAVAGGALAGLEVVQPLAVVVLGGLVTSTLTCLAFVPALYLRFGYVAQPDTTLEDLYIEIPDVETAPPTAQRS